MNPRTRRLRRLRKRARVREQHEAFLRWIGALAAAEAGDRLERLFSDGTIAKQAALVGTPLHGEWLP